MDYMSLLMMGVAFILAAGGLVFVVDTPWETSAESRHAARYGSFAGHAASHR